MNDLSPEAFATENGAMATGDSSHATDMNDLSPEVQLHVINFLSLQDKLHLRQTNHRWLHLVHSSSAELRRDLQVAALKGLARTLDQDSLFCCSGTTQLARPLQLCFHKSVPKAEADQGEKLISGLLRFPLRKNGEKEENGVTITAEEEAREGEALAGLVECCSAATFGQGSKEVLDSSYRHALQLSPDHFVTNFHALEYDILDKIKGILSPKSTKIRAELYKLNIYPKGGHFKAHVDTPRGDSMFGSLVVCLPAAFQGGQLVVRHAQSEVVFDLSSRRSTKKSEMVKEEAPREGEDLTELGCEVKWAAFYSDCEHEILPVTEGHRITLTYNLYSEYIKHQPDKEEEPEEEIVEEEWEEEENYLKWYGNKAEMSEAERARREAAAKQAKERERARKEEERQWQIMREQAYREAKRKRAAEKERAYLEWLKKRRTDKVPTETVGSSPEGERVTHTDFIRRKLDAILQDPDCFSNGITLAFHCKHSYSAEQFSHSPNLSSLLKGFDALVHDAATSLGLKTSLQCFFCLPLSEDKIELCEKAFLVCKSFPQNVNVENFVVGRGDYSEYTLLKFLRYRFQPRLLVDAIPPADPQLRQRKREERIVKAFLAGRHRKYTEEDARRDYQRLLETETNEMKKLNVLPKKAVQWCTDKPDKAADLLVAVTAAYGNEPSTECFYASAMLFVEVPPRSPTNEQNILPSCLQ
ncbi:Fe2OG dioxygenase domain-containing protein [Balamuthia mandrillaris]